jgi:hypothetical protein
MFNWALKLTPKADQRTEGTARERAATRVDGGARERVAAAKEQRAPRVYVARPDDLLQICIAQAVRGADFYAVYDTVLRPSALIDNGFAVMMAECGAVRKVPLRRGGAFVFSESTKQWSLDKRPFLR